ARWRWVDFCRRGAPASCWPSAPSIRVLSTRPAVRLEVTAPVRPGSRHLGDVVVLAFTAALNPTELAAITVMLLLPRPDRLMCGYWLGAMLTGIASGLVIVFALEGSAQHTTTHTVGPVAWLVIAVLLVVAAFALAKGEDQRLRERREARREKKGKEG